MKKIVLIFCFAISCNTDNTMDKKQESGDKNLSKYEDRRNQIQLGVFLSSKKSMEYSLYDIFEEAKQLYESKYQHEHDKKSLFNKNVHGVKYSSFGNAFGGTYAKGNKIEKQILNSTEYVLYQDYNSYSLQMLFHKSKDYDIGFVYTSDSLSNNTLIPGFILVDKLNLNIYFILASKPLDRSVFIDEKSITKIFILDNNLFPVSSLTYNDGQLLYKTLCIYNYGRTSLEFETIFLPDPNENKIKNIESSKLSDIYNYLAYEGIPIGDVKVNQSAFMKEKPLWLMGSFIEYRFNLSK